MLPIEDQLTILNSDTKILDSTVRRPLGNGKTQLVISGELFVDGKECSAIVEGDISFSSLQAWCSHVRGEWNARNNEKEAESARNADARRAAEEQRAADPGNGGGGASPTESNPPVGEETLEETLRSKIAMLARASTWWQDAANASHARYVECERQLNRIEREYTVALGLLRTYMEEMKDDSSENSPQNCLEFSQEEERRADGSSESDTMV